MTFLAQMVAGAIGGALNAALVATRPVGNRNTPLASCLGVAAGIYVGFGLQDGQPNHAFTEILAALPFIAAAMWWPHAIRVLAIAWLAHGVLDSLHLLGVIETRVPYWYPGACLGWDAVLGLAGLHWANALDRPEAAHRAGGDAEQGEAHEARG